jgi:hypothetical protein
MDVKQDRNWGRWRGDKNPIDRGGQGELYRVTDSTGALSGTFVLKELMNSKRLARFENEVEAIASLDRHPNVIHLVDSGIFKDRQKSFYVMPEANEGSLEKALLGKRHDPVHLLGLFQGILSGVAHIHRKGIIHRDIKPANILMFDGVPRVSDLGLSLFAEAPRVTASWEAVGPRFYMAPELEDGRCLEVTPQADIYSLGKLLYFMLSGGKIFAREKHWLPAWSLSAVYEDERYELFLGFFNRSIADSPQLRFSTLDEMLGEFRKIEKEFSAHPGTTLRLKVPAVEDQLSAPRGVLGGLDPGEWAEFLKLRLSRKAPFSREIFETARVLLHRKYGQLLCREAILHEAEMSRTELVELCSRVVRLGTEGLNPFAAIGDERERFQLLALESRDPIVANAIATTGILHWAPRAVLAELCQQHDSLEPEARRDLLNSVRIHRPAGRDRFLIDISRTDISDKTRGLLVDALMQSGTDKALDRVAEILRLPMDERSLAEVVQGIALKASRTKVRALLDQGGFSEIVTKSLSTLLDLG